jgi:hypothetical protein
MTRALATLPEGMLGRDDPGACDAARSTRGGESISRSAELSAVARGVAVLNRCVPRC